MPRTNPPFVDTDVIIRLLTGDDLQKQAKAAELFEQVEKGALNLIAPDTVIADAVYVLSSPRLYNLTRSKIQELLSPLIKLPKFRIKNRRVVFKALNLYASYNLDFGDALIVSLMQQMNSKLLYSFDKDFDHISGIIRQAP